MKKEKIFFLFVSIFLLLIVYSFYSKNYAYVLDISTSFVLITILFVFYKNFNLNWIVFTLVFLALLLHNFGLFGFYNISPLPFEYDHFVHFFGGLALVMFFLNIFNNLENLKLNKFFFILFALFCALGIGSIIEIIEYFGYLFLGKGDGLFYFGGTGDLGNYQDLTGAWVNSSLDMTYNLIGAVIGIILYFIVKKIYQKNQ